MSTKLSRRDFLRLAAMTGAGVALAACTPAATVAPTTAPAVEEEVPTAAPAAKTFSGELRVLGLTGAPVEPACELLTAALTAKYPDVKVKYEYSTGDHSEKVYTAAAAGNLADVFFSADLWVVPFAKNGVALDLKP